MYIGRRRETEGSQFGQRTPIRFLRDLCYSIFLEILSNEVQKSRHDCCVTFLRCSGKLILSGHSNLSIIPVAAVHQDELEQMLLQQYFPPGCRTGSQK